MKLIVAVVHREDVGTVTDTLVAGGFDITCIDESGGALREQFATLLVASADQHADEAKRLIRQVARARPHYLDPVMPILEPTEFFAASPLEVIVGGASVYTLRVSRYVRME